MRKIFWGLLLLIASTQLTKAQTSAITGLVQDEKGNPLHYVFVVDRQYNNAAYTNVNGNFTMTVHPDSKLKLELAGHKDTLVSIDKNNANPGFILRSLAAGNSSAQVDTKTDANGKIILQRSDDNGIAGIPLHEKGNLHGSKYLLNDFTYGFLVSSSEVIIHDPAYKMNYDKIAGIAILSDDDGKTISELSWDKTKTFTLFNDKDETMVFEKIPSLDNSHYLQVLAAGKKYKIYKLIKTKFVRADFVNTGVTSHGNDYDEYVDDADYYVTDAQGNQPKKFTPKKKSIKEVFASDGDKVNKFLADNSGNINDAYLGNLGNYMNQ